MALSRPANFFCSLKTPWKQCCRQIGQSSKRPSIMVPVTVAKIGIDHNPEYRPLTMIADPVGSIGRLCRTTEHPIIYSCGTRAMHPPCCPRRETLYFVMAGIKL